MKIVSLAPATTDLLISLGKEVDLVGVEDELRAAELSKRAACGKNDRGVFGDEGVLWEVLKALKPDAICCSFPFADDDGAQLKKAQAVASANLGDAVRVISYTPVSLAQVYEGIETLGKHFGAAAKGREVAQRMKAQFMDWGDNFYERTRNKKVVVLSSVEPCVVASGWIGDLVRLCSAIPIEPKKKGNQSIRWEDVVVFRPDVIIVAPQFVTLKESVKLFTVCEKFPEWENLPAVKRGEVYFSDGVEHFYRPSLKLIDSMAILTSAIAGFESGYITPRESFFKLRWLEMHRHRVIT
jgi:iron complex transport system substrate-binding protein